MYDRTGVLPTALANKPEPVFMHLLLVWRLFWLLNDSRNYGFSGPLYIGFTQVVAGLDFVGLTEMEERLYVTEMLQDLDRAFVKDWYDTHAPKGTQ